MCDLRRAFRYALMARKSTTAYLLKKRRQVRSRRIRLNTGSVWLQRRLIHSWFLHVSSFSLLFRLSFTAHQRLFFHLYSSIGFLSLFVCSSPQLSALVFFMIRPINELRDLPATRFIYIMLSIIITYNSNRRPSVLPLSIRFIQTKFLLTNVSRRLSRTLLYFFPLSSIKSPAYVSNTTSPVPFYRISFSFNYNIWVSHSYNVVLHSYVSINLFSRLNFLLSHHPAAFILLVFDWLLLLMTVYISSIFISIDEMPDRLFESCGCREEVQ